MELALRTAGFATLNLDYDSRRKGLDALAEDIHPSLDQFARSLDGSVHFVCHSMGGLLARVYLARHPGAARPHRDAGHTERRQRDRRPPEEPRGLSRLFRSGRPAARHPPRCGDQRAAAVDRLLRRHHRRQPLGLSDHLHRPAAAA
ncbi:esterase/lipase family protein [Bradyrhizobium elkanii]|uniref:esterase/lipase family protein n=1 Tax=Bradyrhizobium elkanii TaxID=29448 RepID=UPI0035193E66